jgi:Rrf2 family protein
MTRIAVEATVPRKFLELILADLRGAGFLNSTRGKMGGYRLAKPPHLISMGEIIRVIEGPLALVPCVSRTAYRRCLDCKSEADCAIRHAMMRVRDETARILDGTSLADATASDLVAA